MTLALAVERRTFAEHKAALLAAGENRYALIHGEEIAGVYESQQDAIDEGYRRFGNVPFLVKRIVQVEVPMRFFSNLLNL